MSSVPAVTDRAALAAVAEQGRALILSLQDAEGAYPASPTFSAYQGFAWFRDGSFIADAMSAAGEVASASAFYDWCARAMVARRDDVARIVAHFFAEEKPIGTLCHGPQVPAALGLLRGRRSAAFGPLAPDIELAGGEFVDGPAVVDGNMVSCRGWGDLAEWSRSFLELLGRSSAAG